jgi:hypothetical protein
VSAVLAIALVAGVYEPRAALIWGGGTSRADAERWLAVWQQTARPLDDLHQLAPGYPRIATGNTLPGLEPNEHVVLLGICRVADIAPRAAYFKGLYAGASVRKVRSKEEACPTLGPGVSVEHSQSLSANANTLTLTQLATPRGTLLHATLISREGALLDSEAFGAPREGPSTCFGGFRSDDYAFEVTLCEGSVESGACCEARHVTRLSAVEGKLEQQALSPPAPSQPDVPDAQRCRRVSSVEGSFTDTGARERAVLEVCEGSKLPQGGGFVQIPHTAWLRIERVDRVLARQEVARWTEGWEWGAHAELSGVLPLGTTGRDAVLVRFVSSDEEHTSATVTAYDGVFRALWKEQADVLDVSVVGSTLQVTALVSERRRDDPKIGERHTVVWNNGELERRR